MSRITHHLIQRGALLHLARPRAPLPLLIKYSPLLMANYNTARDRNNNSQYQKESAPNETNPQFSSEKRGWSERLSFWGSKEPITEDPHDVSTILSEVKSISETANNSLIQATEDVSKTHLRTIQDIRNALEQNKFLVFTRPDREKQQLVFRELQKIRDYYNSIVTSEQYPRIKKSLSNALATAELSKSKLDTKITQLRGLITSLESRLRALSPTQNLERSAITTQLQQRQMALKLLQDFRTTINQLPEQIQLSQKNAQNFFRAIELNSEVLVSTCQTYGLIMQIQDAFDTLKLLKEMDTRIKEIQLSWSHVNDIIKNIATGVENHMAREKQEYTSQNGSDYSVTIVSPQGRR